MDQLLRNDLVVKASVQHLAKLSGASGQEYEIDIAYRFRVANVDYLTLVECKHWNKPVGRDVVSALRSVVQDVGAHKGLIVSTIGFQKGAIGLALSSGIGLLKVTDKQQKQVHVVAHFEGPIADSFWHLLNHSPKTRLRGYVSIEGITGTTLPIQEYFASRFGQTVSDFIFSLPTSQMLDEYAAPLLDDIRARLHNLGNWSSEYLKIEACGLLVEPQAFSDVRVARFRIKAARELIGNVGMNDQNSLGNHQRDGQQHE